MRRKDEDLTNTTCCKTEKGKRRKNVSIHMHDTLKSNCEEKKNSRKKEKKTTTENGVNGIRTHIYENRWLLVYIYSINERSTYCAIESFDNYM